MLSKKELLSKTKEPQFTGVDGYTFGGFSTPVEKVKHIY
jgi:hypothetical protein